MIIFIKIRFRELVPGRRERGVVVLKFCSNVSNLLLSGNAFLFGASFIKFLYFSPALHQHEFNIKTLETRFTSRNLYQFTSTEFNRASVCLSWDWGEIYSKNVEFSNKKYQFQDSLIFNFLL